MSMLSELVLRAPRQRTLMSLCKRAKKAISGVGAKMALIWGILLAVIHMPTPLLQMRMALKSGPISGSFFISF